MKALNNIVLAHSIIIILMYAVAPQYPDTVFTLCSFTFFCFQLYTYSKFAKKTITNNYFEFNIFFFLMLGLCTYVIPFFYIFGLEYDFYTTIIYNPQYMNTTLIINAIAVEAYYAGYIKGQRVIMPPSSNSYILEHKIYSFNRISRIICLISTLFILVAINRLASTSVDIRGAIVTIMNITILVPIIIAGYSNKYLKYGPVEFIYKNCLVLVCSALVLLRMTLLGDRLTPLCIIFTIGFVYSRFVKPIGLKTLILGIITGGFLMFLVSFTRDNFMQTSSTSDMVSSFETGGKDVFASDEKTVLFQDVIPINLDFMLAVEVTEKNGYYKPMRFIIEMLAPIPYVPALLKELFFDGYTSTAKELTLQNQRVSVTAGNSGLGTHIVCDIYMSWGILGVILVFFVWGSVIGKCYINADDNIIACILFASMMSYAIYFPRATVDTNFRDMAYMVVFFYMIKKLVRK